jgi:3-isopropylmalate/(R)-2-methylmalate dehydratase small subunit
VHPWRQKTARVENPCYFHRRVGRPIIVDPKEVNMETIITGKAYVLGDNIDTDQIIPAQYLSFNPSLPDERKFFGMYANSGVPENQAGLPQGKIPFVRPNEYKSDYTIVIGGKNFGCGSSREHAPLALAEAGIKAVIAEFYARIFFRNSINGGYLLPLESTQRLVEKIRTGDELEIDLKAGKVTNKTQNQTYELQPVGDVLPIIEAGGVFDYAKKAGMLK